MSINSQTRSRLNIWIPSRDQNAHIYYFVILIIVFTFFALILYKEINQCMSVSDYERKSHLKYEIFIKNVISCANKQREMCF